MKYILILCFLFLITSKNLRYTADWNWNVVHTNLVNLHNTLRAKHKSPKLTKSDAVAKFAKQATDHCVQKGGLEHTYHTYQGTTIGQNLYLASWAPSADDVVKSWYYNEEPHYDYAKGTSKDGEVTGHFTAMVWKSTKEVGCAYSTGKWGNYNGYYVACEYYPLGNVRGQYTTNVAKPSS